MFGVREIIKEFENEKDVDAGDNPVSKDLKSDKRMKYLNLFFGLLSENTPLTADEIIEKGIIKKYDGMLSESFRKSFNRLNSNLLCMKGKGLILPGEGKGRSKKYKANPEIVYFFLRRYSLTEDEFEGYKQVINYELSKDCLFNWNDIHRAKTKRIVRVHLMKIFNGWNWLKTAKITKSANGIIFTHERGSVELKPNEEKNKIILELNGWRKMRYEFILKENGDVHLKGLEFKPMEMNGVKHYGSILANVNRPIPAILDNFVDTMYIFLNEFFGRDIRRGCDMLTIISAAVNCQPLYTDRENNPIIEFKFNDKRCPFIGWFKFGYNQTYFPPDYMNALSIFDRKNVKELKKLKESSQKKIDDIDSSTQEEFNEKFQEADLSEFSILSELESRIDNILRESYNERFAYEHEPLTDYEYNIREYMDEYFRRFPPENLEKVKAFIKTVPDHFLKEVYGETNWERRLDDIINTNTII